LTAARRVVSTLLLPKKKPGSSRALQGFRLGFRRRHRLTRISPCRVRRVAPPLVCRRYVHLLITPHPGIPGGRSRSGLPPPVSDAGRSSPSWSRGPLRGTRVSRCAHPGSPGWTVTRVTSSLPRESPRSGRAGAGPVELRLVGLRRDRRGLGIPRTFTVTPPDEPNIL